MTEINFYVSKEEGLEHRLAIAHRLILIAFKRKMHIHIHTDSEATSVKLDDYLWTKDNTSFIPHSIIDGDHDTSSIQSIKELNTEDASQKPYEISISHNHEPLSNCDYLINLSNQQTNFFSRFTKVAEILDNSEEIITTGRKRYSFYKDRGYTLGYHKM